MKREEKILMAELDSLTPDVCERVKAAAEWQKPEKEERRFKPTFFRLSVAVIACCALVFAFAFLITSGGLSVQGLEYQIIIDVNPSVSLTVDENDKVISQQGLNEDGCILLYKKNYVGKNARTATQAIVTEMKSAGLVSSKLVKITTIDAKTKKTISKKREEIVASITEYFKSDDLHAVYITDEELDEIEDYFESRDFSEYEKQMLKDFKSKLRVAVEEKLRAIDDLIAVLIPFSGDSGNIVTDEAALSTLSNYVKKYKLHPEFSLSAPTDEDVAEFLEELEENAEELNESLEEIDEETDEDDYADILEDLFEIVKEELFAENDD